MKIGNEIVRKTALVMLLFVVVCLLLVLPIVVTYLAEWFIGYKVN